MAILEKAFDVVIADQLITESAGEETLTFSLPRNDPKLDLIDNEDHIQVGGSEFVIRLVEDGWSASKYQVDITAEAVWYDLAEYDPITSINFQAVGPTTVMEAILQGTNFSVGTVEITTPGDFSITTPTNPLKAIRQVPTIYGGELEFDSINGVVNLRQQVGNQDTGVLYAYKKNLKSNKRIVDTKNLVTVLYPYGTNNLSISAVNNGLEYIENYQWYDSTGKARQRKVATLTNGDIGNPSYLKTWAETQLNAMSVPQVTYQMDVQAGVGDTIPRCGDIVTVYDSELGLNMKVRVAKRSYNVLEPWKSTLELDSAVSTLTDTLSHGTQSGNVANVTGAINDAFKNVVMFNNLFNSRADDGLAYWISNGWDVDATKGASGTSSFHATGDASLSKTLAQTIYPASRTNYTLSAQVELDNIVKQAGGRVGFNITIKYKDGTLETQFFSLA